MTNWNVAATGFQLRTPFTAYATGRSGSGKTYTTSHILARPLSYANITKYPYKGMNGEQKAQPFSKFKRIMVFAPEEQSYESWECLDAMLAPQTTEEHNTVIEAPSVECYSMTQFTPVCDKVVFQKTDIDPWLIVCEDFACCEKRDVVTLSRIFTSASHHKNVSIMVLTQHVILGEGSSNMRLKRNLQYLFQFRCKDIVETQTTLTPFFGKHVLQILMQSMRNGLMEMLTRHWACYWDLAEGSFPDLKLAVIFNKDYVKLSNYFDRRATDYFSNEPLKRGAATRSTTLPTCKRAKNDGAPGKDCPESTSDQ